jgi:hypothetical protein
LGSPKNERAEKTELIITTLALGSWPRQRLANVQAKSVAWESNFMLLIL